MNCERCKFEDTLECVKCHLRSLSAIVEQCNGYCKECENRTECERMVKDVN